VPRGDPRSPSSPATSPTPRPKQPPVPRGAPPATFLAGYVPDAEAEAASHAPRGSPATFLPGNVPDDEPEAAPRSALPPLRHQSRLGRRGATASRLRPLRQHRPRRRPGFHKQSPRNKSSGPVDSRRSAHQRNSCFNLRCFGSDSDASRRGAGSWELISGGGRHRASDRKPS
jgi:hypothetical protein